MIWCITLHLITLCFMLVAAVVSALLGAALKYFTNQQNLTLHRPCAKEKKLQNLWQIRFGDIAELMVGELILACLNLEKEV
jgi:L-cystine uptake protein TcyP (sodium:dicarboxylate symporter family)